MKDIIWLIAIILILITFVLVLIFAIQKTSELKKFKYENCGIQILHTKGPLYEKVKKECRNIEIFDKSGKTIKTIKQ